MSSPDVIVAGAVNVWPPAENIYAPSGASPEMPRTLDATTTFVTGRAAPKKRTSSIARFCSSSSSVRTRS